MCSRVCAFGVDWAWVDTPLWEYTVFSNPDVATAKRFVLTPPELTAEQVETALEDYVSMKRRVKPSTADSEAIEELIGRTLAVALTGNPQGRRNLQRMLKELGLDGHAGEIYFDAFEVYQGYASEAGKVPPLP